MAEKDKDIDALFRAGLADHSEAPLPNSWNRLQERLSEQRNRRIVFWRSTAASLLLLTGAISVLWYSVHMSDQEIQTLAEEYVQKEPGLLIDRAEDEQMPPLPAEENLVLGDTVQDTSPNSVNSEQTRPVEKSESTPIRKTIAMNDRDIIPERVKEKVPAITKLEPSDPELPGVDFSPEVKETIHKKQEGEVAYTVTIISNGITEKPAKDNLVKEIEDKIDKLGGVVYKMDQGFADLQDAKNELFASITSKDRSRKSK